MILIPPGPKQLYSIAHANARLNLWEGSVRSGKTIASIIRWLAFVVEAPPGPLLMVGKTRETLKRNILDVISELLDPADYRLVYGSGEAFIFGRRILLASANDERSEGKIRGLTLVGAYGDELTLWPESFFTMLLSRLSVTGAKFFGTTNPDAPRHWFKVRYLDRESELDMARFHFRLDDNPALGPEYVANLKLEYTGLWYARYIEGKWSAAEGAVYDLFDPDEHTLDIMPNIQLSHVGIDYGTANPTVFHSGGLQHDALYITGEWSYDGRTKGKSMTDAQYSKAFQEWIGWPVQVRSIDVDPSAASFKAQLLQDGIRPVRSANNDVLDGIRVVSRALANGQLYIHKSCEGLIAEMTSYAWDPKAQDRGEDAPMKLDDHHVDALRYLTMRALKHRGLPSIPKPEAA